MVPHNVREVLAIAVGSLAEHCRVAALQNVVLDAGRIFDSQRTEGQLELALFRGDAFDHIIHTLVSVQQID